jgi:hypothetical protein
MAAAKGKPHIIGMIVVDLPSKHTTLLLDRNAGPALSLEAVVWLGGSF